jgi:tryptophan synthase alpha chain
LLAPTTTASRIPEITRGTSGFLYYISRTGVTGAREAVRSELATEIETIREMTALPIAVGFGISTPEQAALVSGIADGVVVGSALIDAVAHQGVAGGGRFLAALRSAMGDAGP